MTSRGKGKVWKRVLSCFLTLTLAFGTLTFTGKEAEVAKAAENTMTITQTESAWYELSKGHANFKCELTGAAFENPSNNIFSEAFVEQYVRFGGGMTKADFFEGFTYGGLALGNTFQVQWGNRTRKFESGWSFTIAQGAPITYNGSSATVTLDREYTFTFADGGTDCDNYCTPQGYYTNTFTIDTQKSFNGKEFGNGIVQGENVPTTQFYITTDGMRAPAGTAPSFIGNEEYREYISISGLTFDEYASKNIKLRYILNSNDKCIQFQDWGDLRTLLSKGDQIVFHKGLPLYYTDTDGNACVTRLAHTQVVECVGDNNKNNQVFYIVSLDETVPMYGLKTDTQTTVAQSTTNLEQYINVPFTAGGTKLDGVRVDAMNQTIAEKYVELSDYTFEEARQLGVAVRFISDASVLQLGFSTDAVSALPVGTTLTLKKGMPVTYTKDNKLNAVILDSDYIFTLTKNDGTKLTWEYVVHDTYVFSQPTTNVTGTEYGDYNRYPLTIMPDAFSDRGTTCQGKLPDIAWEYVKFSNHSMDDVQADGTFLNWYVYAANVFQGIRLYSKLTFTDGETMTFMKGLPITYTTNDGRKKVSTLARDYVWQWDATNEIWKITEDPVRISIEGITNPSQATGSWYLYLKTNVHISNSDAENWYAVDGKAEVFPVQISLNDNEPITVTGKQGGQKHMFLEINYTNLSKQSQAKVTVKKGCYPSNVRNKVWIVEEDYSFYMNQYGIRETGYVTCSDKPIYPSLDAEHVNSSTINGFVISTKYDDGAAYDKDEAWNAAYQLQPWGKARETDTTLYLESNSDAAMKNGLYVNGEFHQEIPVWKLTDVNYYVPLSDLYGKDSVPTDNVYQIKGRYSDKDGKILYYESAKVKWTGEKWETVIEGLADTGVKYDVNADEKLNSQDLIRVLRNVENVNIEVNFTYADVNRDGKIDANDISAMRDVLLGNFWYEQNDTTPYGTPVFDENLTVERLAYACPSIVDENGKIMSEVEIDAILQEYKDTGLTMLNTEFVAPITTEAYAHTSNDRLRAYLNGAQRNGLGVIVHCDYLTHILTTNLPNNWKNIMDGYVGYLKQFPAFRGFGVGDEIATDKTANYREITSYLKEKYPELILFTSQLPTYAESFYKHFLWNTWFDESLYKNYIEDVGPISGYFTYDNYALICDEGQDTNHQVMDSWYTNLKLVAENSVDANGNQKYIPGVTIQSFSMKYTDSQERYAPTEKADIGFQMYTALAWGMQSINYFAYGVHPDTSNEELADEMMENPAVKASVTAANSDLATFDHVYKSFTWKNTLDVAAGGNVTSTKNTRLTSAKATGGRAFVGCMQDVYGFDGYMVANAEGPRSGKTSTVTLTLKNATKAWVYYNGTKEEVTLTYNSKDDVYTYTQALKAGEGMFVIPIR